MASVKGNAAVEYALDRAYNQAYLKIYFSEKEGADLFHDICESRITSDQNVSREVSLTLDRATSLGLGGLKELLSRLVESVSAGRHEMFACRFISNPLKASVKASDYRSYFKKSFGTINLSESRMRARACSGEPFILQGYAIEVADKLRLQGRKTLLTQEDSGVLVLLSDLRKGESMNFISVCPPSPEKSWAEA